MGAVSATLAKPKRGYSVLDRPYPLGHTFEPMSAIRPLVIASDVHLSHGSSRDAAGALSRLISAHGGYEIVLSGDIFNLSSDAPGREPMSSVLDMLRPHAELRSALRSHLASGAPVTLLAGNHDAAVMRSELRPALLESLDLGPDAPFENLPWFIRRGSVHVEHGHVYDPDNAPTHPLWYAGPEAEPLGVALTRRFVAPNDAFDFAHEHEVTPLAGFLKAVRVFGPRTPLLVTRYFRTAAALCWEATRDDLTSRVQRAGEQQVPRYAELTELPVELVHRLLEGLPEPTHHDLRETFFRLYFDRVLASVGTVTGIGAGALLRSRSAFALGLLAAGYLLGSGRKSANRYRARPVECLREAAQSVRELTDASLVVFGHVHVEDAAPGYINSASFTYHEGPGWPYVHVAEDGRAERRRLSA